LKKCNRCKELAEEYAEDHNGKVARDKKITLRIENKIWSDFYYGQGWKYHNGGFANVEELGVACVGNRYHVFAYVEHGIQDCGSGHAVTYSDDVEFEMNEKFEVIDNVRE